MYHHCTYYVQKWTSEILVSDAITGITELVTGTVMWSVMGPVTSS